MFTLHLQRVLKVSKSFFLEFKHVFCSECVDYSTKSLSFVFMGVSKTYYVMFDDFVIGKRFFELEDHLYWNNKCLSNSIYANAL